MSKTKDEILQHHYIHDRGLVNPVLYVHNAMDAWADQKLEEYKEKLKAEIHAIKVTTTNPDWIDAEVCMANKIIDKL